MKYIILEDQKTHWLHPVIFPDFVTHSSIKLEGAKPVSAGFVDWRTGRPSGKSESLGLQSTERDQPWLYAALTNKGSILTLLNVNLTVPDQEPGSYTRAGASTQEKGATTV